MSRKQSLKTIVKNNPKLSQKKLIELFQQENTTKNKTDIKRELFKIKPSLFKTPPKLKKKTLKTEAEKSFKRYARNNWKKKPNISLNKMIELFNVNNKKGYTISNEKARKNAIELYVNRKSGLYVPKNPPKQKDIKINIGYKKPEMFYYDGKYYPLLNPNDDKRTFYFSPKRYVCLMEYEVRKDDFYEVRHMFVYADSPDYEKFKDYVLDYWKLEYLEKEEEYYYTFELIIESIKPYIDEDGSLKVYDTAKQKSIKK